MARKRFHLIEVPADLHSQLRHHEKLCLQLGAATDRDEIELLFSKLCYARHHLYSYLEAHCEPAYGKGHSVFLRFL